jgi:membrane protease YdiL (CAAX protease family)
MIDTRKSTAYHPALLLIFLVLISAIAAIAFTLIGMLFWFAVDSSASLGALSNASAQGNITFIRIIQIFSTFGLFIVGPIAYSFLAGVKPKHYFYFDEKVNWKLFFIVIALLFCSTALLEWITALNQKMSLPEALHGMEVWMKQKENEAAGVTKMLLVMKNYSDFSINLLMIAILPAIGEELFFRGGIQNILIQWFKNHHVAIWVTAILFSAIHLQFYGFFPRMFLGALFGYLLVYGKSIWYAILGHFLNNGTAVVMAFILQKQGKSLEEIDKTSSFEWYGYLISAILTLILLFAFFRIANKEKKTISYE